MSVFYVRLFQPNDPAASPQKDTIYPLSKEAKPDQDILRRRRDTAHKKAIEQLHHVKTNYSFERRIFW